MEMKLLALVMGCIFISNSYALTDAERIRLEALRSFSLEDLQQLTIYNPAGGLAGRKNQKLMETPGALFVITQEDIRRSGFTNLAEALRMVPGMQVGRLDGNKWAISARGFNSRFAGKLLVMIDGRTVYSLLRTEVLWDVQDTLLEDVERIEVLRGPGAALWGANAVNGVVNIVTKATAETQGTLMSLHTGTGEERAVVSMRYGDKMSDKGHYRLYAKYYNFDYMKNAMGEDQDSRWHNFRSGFRSDWRLAKYDTLTVQGDIYDGSSRQENVNPRTGQLINSEGINVSGHNLLTRWYRELHEGDMSLQFYYDWNERHELGFDDSHGTFDLDFQHRRIFNPRFEFIWGLNYRYTQDELLGDENLFYEPEERADKLYSFFLHTDYALIPDKLRLLVGSKFSHNDYSGFEYQPSVRLLWNVNEQHQLWTSLSRAVRTPSRTDEDTNLIVSAGPNLKFYIKGNDKFESEELLAHEIGWRYRPTNNFLFDAVAFFHKYDKLGPHGEIVDFIPPNTLVQKLINGHQGHTFGAEFSVHWQASETWKLGINYHYFDMHLDFMPGKFGDANRANGATPHHQAGLHSYLDLSHHWTWDSSLYYVDNVPKNDIGKYFRLDTRLAWQPTNHWELALGARNLLDNQHPEFQDFTGEAEGEVPRTFYVQVKYTSH